MFRDKPKTKLIEESWKIRTIGDGSILDVINRLRNRFEHIGGLGSIAQYSAQHWRYESAAHDLLARGSTDQANEMLFKAGELAKKIKGLVAEQDQILSEIQRLSDLFDQSTQPRRVNDEHEQE